MGDKTGIEWTDATWNPVTGCAKVSQGCKHCYAERDWKRLAHLPAYAGRAFTDVACHQDRLDQPLRWVKPRRIFVNSMSDLFHEDVPFEFIASVFAIMGVTTRHTYQILTKRPARMLEFFKWALQAQDEDGTYYPISATDFSADERIFSHWPESIPWKRYDNCGPRFPYENVWLGVSVEDQATADERIPLLLQAPAAVRWISAEPLIGRVDLCGQLGMWWNQTMQCFESTGSHINRADNGRGRIDWVVVGGESGPKARPMHPDWARSLRDQCVAAGVPFLFKQHGEWLATEFCDDAMASVPSKRTVYVRRDGSYHDGSQGIDFFGGDEETAWIGKKIAGRVLDGRTWDEYPQRQAQE